MRYKIIDEEVVESLIKFLDEIQFGTAKHGMKKSMLWYEMQSLILEKRSTIRSYLLVGDCMSVKMILIVKKK